MAWTLARLLGIRKGELRQVGLLAAYLFLTITAYMIVKAVRGALFISEFGALKLPYAMIGIALLAGGVAAIHLRLIRRYPLTRLLIGTLLFLSANALGLWALARAGFFWLPALLYIWAGLLGVVATTQVWMLAGQILTTRQAKRLFGPIGAGGILGGAFGGWLTDRLAPWLGATQLLAVVAILLTAAAWTVLGLARFSPSLPLGAEARGDGSLFRSLRQIREQRHVRLLAALVFITAMATTSVEFQFALSAERHLADRDALASFFGLVYGALSLGAFAFQVVVTPRVLRRFGVGVAVLLLPLTLLLGSAVLFVTGALWAAVLLKAGDGALKHALDRSCRELMFLPVPARVKLQTKATIDTVLDRLGDGAAGLLQLVLTGAAGLGLRGSVAVNAGLIAAWVALAALARRSYTGQLSEALGRPGRRFLARATEAPGADALAVLERLIREGRPAERQGALEWARRQHVSLDPRLLIDTALAAPPGEIRQGALMLLLQPHDAPLPERLLEGIDDVGRGAILRAVDRGSRAGNAEDDLRLQAALADVPPEARFPAAAWLARNRATLRQPVINVFRAALRRRDAPEVRASALRSIVLFEPEQRAAFALEPHLDPTEPKVCIAAIDAVGALRRAELVPRLADLATQASLRPIVRQAIERIGPGAAEPLQHLLSDPRTPFEVRLGVPSLLGRLPIEQAVDGLLRAIDDAEPRISQRAVEVLVRLRSAAPEWPVVDMSRLRGWMEPVCRRIVRMGAWRCGLIRSGRESHRWLAEAVEQAREDQLCRLFRLMALYYSPAEMQGAWIGIRSANPRRKANALELLDNRLSARLRADVLPLLEFGAHGEAPAERAVAEIAHEPGWLSAWALYAARETRQPGLESAAQQRLHSVDPLVHEAARRYLEGGDGKAA